jgi:uncharacterized membrane protein YkvA (DUF1232 family)
MKLSKLLRGHRRRRRFGLLRRNDSAARHFATGMIRQLPSLLRLVVRLFRDARIGMPAKALFGAVALYVVAPFDLIPDVLGFLGLVDDVYFVGLALHMLLKSAGPDILIEHWDGDPKELGYLVEGVEQVGDLLPARVRGILRATVKRA